MSRAVADNVVAFDDGRLLTRNLAPGQRVYDEELHTLDGDEWRTWNPTRSKLGAYLVKGGRNFPVRRDSRVLYLGAANGTTPSHVSDVARDGLLVAVEFSPRSFRDLLRVAGPRPNMVPVLADAWRPELYERFLGRVDVLFQDIAQRQQAAIFAKNVNRFKPAVAMIAVKARSVDVAAHPRDVYAAVSEEVERLTGYSALETVELGPYEKDHAAVVFRPGGGKRDAPPRRDVRAERREPRDEPREERRFQRGPDRPQRFEKRPRDEGPRGGGGGFRPKGEGRPGPGPGRPDRRPPRDDGERRKWR